MKKMNKLDSSRKNLCRCLSCGKVFEFKDKKEVKCNGIGRFVCPDCGHTFTIIQMANWDDENYVNRYQYSNPNNLMP